KGWPNYALLAFSSSSPDSKVSNDSICSKSCLETVELLKSQNDQLCNDLKKFELKVLGEITIRELRKKLETVQKEKVGIQLNVDKFEHAYKSLNKLIECQIVDNYKKGLGYKNYNAVPPPYTGNFMPPTPDFSFTSLDEFINDPLVENYDEEEDVSQHKTEKKIVRPIIVKKEFVKSKQQEKTARKTVKQVEKHRQNTHSPRHNQRNWNNMMSQKLGSNFEMFNKACYVCRSFDHLQNLVPRAVLMKSGLVSINTARHVNAAHSKTTVNVARPMSYLSETAHSTVKRPINKAKVVVNAVKGNNLNALKALACWVWKPKHKALDHDQGVIDSGCSRHMTGNMSYLTDYEKIDGGYVAFGGNIAKV
ncbi:hypothetical protein Tco_1533745, partial [Tanacetum coccineum]